MEGQRAAGGFSSGSKSILPAHARIALNESSSTSSADRIALNASAAGSSKTSAASSAHNNFLPAHDRIALNASAEGTSTSFSDWNPLNGSTEGAAGRCNFLPARDRIALNGSVEGIASSTSSVDWNPLNGSAEGVAGGCVGSSMNSAVTVASSLHNNFLPAHGRIALNGFAEGIASSTLFADRNPLNGSVEGAAGGCSKTSVVTTASSAHNNFLPAHDRIALNGSAEGIASSTSSADRNPLNDSAKGAASLSFLEKATLKGDGLHHTSGCINNGSALWHMEDSSCEVAGHNEVAYCSHQQSVPNNSSCGVAKLKSYTWHGMHIELPAALHLCRWCSLNNGVLEFRGSNAVLREGMSLLDVAAFPHLQYNIVDGALWLKMPSSQYTDMLPGPVSQLLGLWEKRFGFVNKYTVSGSSGMIYNSNLSKMLIADCCIFDTEVFAAAKIADNNLGRVVPWDLKAEVVFECVSITDDVTETWDKCERYISSQRAKMAIGICDRADQKEVLISYRDIHGDVTSEVQRDPRFIDLGRVLWGFRIYLSYLTPIVFMHFTVQHVYDLRTMSDDDRELLLCSQIIKGENELAMEIINGLGTINFNNSLGRNPLVCAATIGNKEAAKYLLDNGGKVDFRDGRGVSPLLAAKAEGMMDMIEFLNKFGAVVDLSLHALVEAVRKDEPRQLELLIKAGANVDEADRRGRTPLMHAVLSESVECARICVSAGAPCTLKDCRGDSALDMAAENDALLDILASSN